MTEIYPGCFAGEASSGLRVLAEPMPGFRSVALGLWVQAGGREDPPGKEGLAHFVEHMTFKGTTRRSALEIAQSIDALGGHLNAATTAEYTFFYTEVLSAHLPEAWDILVELVTSPRFAPEDLPRERVVVAEEIRAAEDDPEDTAFRLLGELLWRDGHPLGKPVIGRLDSVARIELEDLWRFFGRHYHPREMVFVACGGADPEKVFSLAERFPAREGAGDPRPRTPPQAGTGLALAERDINQVHLVLGFPTVPASAPERYALEVLNALLGGGVSSRLFQRVREELGLVYAVFSATAYFSDAGVLSVYAAAEEKKLPQVAAAIWEEIEALRRAPPAPGDVDRAVQRLCNAFLLNLDDPSGRMVRLGTLAALGRKPASPEEVVQRFRQVTPEAVQELAHRFLGSERAAWAAVGPSGERIRRALRPFVEVA
ncbi:MAG: insulinase family protein [Candidatus Bipolaricaulota bacterium]|nr:insulinase family protein [Candidatus Bipolaricaulota bacterium]MCX7844069.1 insulinase family protein [Candidatus Bipolaricaulota bacterium]MDW8151944.1 pitrilysin family protein [Candidatus Bipolaricaulota bacterium]